MIRIFGDRESERIFSRLGLTRLAPAVRRAALKKLLMLHAAESLQDLAVPPGNRLERLPGDRRSQYSIRINDQWRVCFRWEAGDAYEVQITDYH